MRPGQPRVLESPRGTPRPGKGKKIFLRPSTERGGSSRPVKKKKTKAEFFRRKKRGGGKKN